jgi:potassium/hydrogen antiporter
MPSMESLLLITAALLLLSLLASKASERLGVPSLLLFLGVGMLAGSDGPGGIAFDNAHLAQAIGIVALTFILFSGGLETEHRAIREAFPRVLSLSTLGVFLTAVLVAVCARYVMKLSWQEALLFGSVISATDAAAVFSVLRSRGVHLKSPLRPTLEMESGSNDPMAVFLTVGFIDLMTTGSPWSHLIWIFIRQMALGAIFGLGAGRLMRFALARVKLEHEGLYPALTVSLVLFTYGLTSSIGGNGFLAVYLASLVLGRTDFLHKKTLVRFHDALAWLMQIVMFLTLGLLVFPSRLLPIAGPGLILAIFLILVARPVSVFIALAGSRMGIRDKLLIAWVGLRGAAPIILATFPMVADIPGSDTLFHLVFFVVVTSVLLQGPWIPAVASWLKVTSASGPPRRLPIEFDPPENSDTDLQEFILPFEGGAVGKTIVQIGLPAASLIVLILRNGQYLLPGGTTRLAGGDVLMVLVTRATASRVSELLSGKTASSL